VKGYCGISEHYSTHPEEYDLKKKAQSWEKIIQTHSYLKEYSMEYFGKEMKNVSLAFQWWKQTYWAYLNQKRKLEKMELMSASPQKIIKKLNQILHVATNQFDSHLKARGYLPITHFYSNEKLTQLVI
jgi:hypothetical protein